MKTTVSRNRKLPVPFFCLATKLVLLANFKGRRETGKRANSQGEKITLKLLTKKLLQVIPSYASCRLLKQMVTVFNSTHIRLLTHQHAFCAY